MGRGMAIRPDTARLGRRRFVTIAGAGALTGSAWGLALREALGEDATPTVTVARTASSFAALIDHQRRRLLVLDGELQDDATELADMVTGVMRQRIDIVLASHDGIERIPRGFPGRWRVDRVMELSQGGGDAAWSFSGRALRVGGMTVTPARQVLSAWRYAASDIPSPWFVTVTYGSSQILIAGAGAALDRLPIDPDAASCLVTVDQIDRLPPGAITTALATPAEGNLAEIVEARPEIAIIPIRTRTPLRVRVRKSAIELPADA